MIVVVDAGAMVALSDRREAQHFAIRDLYVRTGADWLLPAGILAEVDYLLSTRVGAATRESWLEDLSDGTFPVIWHNHRDLHTALALDRRYADLNLGLVDALVMATAERLQAEAIVTLDLRHFAAVELKGRPRLWPRDVS